MSSMQDCILGNARAKTSHIVENHDDGKQNSHEAETNRFKIIWAIFDVDTLQSWLSKMRPWSMPETFIRKYKHIHYISNLLSLKVIE